MPKRPRQQPTQPMSLAAAARRQRWRKENARVVVEAYRDSGLTMREFAANHGVPLKRLERWSAKLKNQNRQAEPPLRFLPVEVTAPPAVPAGHQLLPAPDAMQGALASGVFVTVGPGFDAGALQRLIETVGC